MARAMAVVAVVRVRFPVASPAEEGVWECVLVVLVRVRELPGRRGDGETGFQRPQMGACGCVVAASGIIRGDGERRKVSSLAIAPVVC